MRVSLDWLESFVDIKGRLDLDKVCSTLTMAGLEVTSVLDIEGDSVMDIEITPNRPDCLSILGVAREFTAAADKILKIPTSIKKDYMKKGPIRGSAKIEVADKKGCLRYVGCILKNVKVALSPEWLVDRLNTMGVRSVNNIVDITNYVLFETGQPLHAFDLDKLAGKRIIVRRAKKGESIVTIDGVKRDLGSTMLIIADAEKPVAIAGIMGGKDTEISGGTKNILLESAYFDPITVRKSQRKLGLASESSYRFERSVDMGMILSASTRARGMIKDIGGGRISGNVTDIGPRLAKEKEILLSLEEIPRVLGIEIGSKKVMDCFKRLNLGPVKKGKNSILVKIPFYRQDLNKEIDLIEEIVRLYGYDKVPVKFPTFIAQKAYEEEKKELSSLEKEAKRVLCSLGLNEIVSYTLTSRSAIENLGISPDHLIRLRNPLSSNQEFMRPTLLSEMLEVTNWNLNRKNTLLQLFELSKVYLRSKDKGEIEEKLDLCVCMCGTTNGSWKEKPRAIDFFDLKGVIGLFLTALGIKDYSIENAESFMFKDKMSTKLKIKDDVIGVMGEVKSDLARKFGIKQKVYLAEISFQDLLKYANLNKRFVSLPRYPSMRRDISIVVNDSVSAGDINALIREEGKGLVRSIEIFDLYKGQQIERDKKSLAYAIEYRSDEKTLKDEDVTRIHKDIQERLIEKLSAQIR